MISMPDDLLKELDQAAKETHKRRSELIKDLALKYLRGGAEERGTSSWSPSVQEAFERLREYRFELEPGETAEGLIREMRDSR